MGNTNKTKSENYSFSNKQILLFAERSSNKETTAKLSNALKNFVESFNQRNSVKLRLISDLQEAEKHIYFFLITVCPVSRLQKFILRAEKLAETKAILVFSEGQKVNQPEKIFRLCSKIANIVVSTAEIGPAVEELFGKYVEETQIVESERKLTQAKSSVIRRNLTLTSMSGRGSDGVLFNSDEMLFVDDLVSWSRVLKTTKRLKNEGNEICLLENTRVDREIDVFSVFEQQMSKMRIDFSSYSNEKELIISSVCWFLKDSPEKLHQARKSASSERTIDEFRELAAGFLSDCIEKVNEGLGRLKQRDRAAVRCLVYNAAKRPLEGTFYMRMRVDTNELTDTFLVRQFTKLTKARPSSQKGSLVFALRIGENEGLQTFIRTSKGIVLLPFTEVMVDSASSDTVFCRISAKSTLYRLVMDTEDMLMEIKTQKHYNDVILEEIEWFESYKSVVSGHSDTELARVCNTLALLEAEVDRFDSALKNIKISSELLREGSPSSFLAVCATEIDVLIKANRLTDAKQAINWSATNFDWSDSANLSFYTLLNIFSAELALMTENVDDAHTAASKASTLLFQAKEDNTLLSFKLNMLKGRVYTAMGNLNLAVAEYSSALSYLIGRFEQRSPLLKQVYLRLSDLYRSKGCTEASAKMRDKAVEVSQRYSNKEGMFDIYFNLGEQLCEEGDVEGALEHFLDCLSIREAMDKPDKDFPELLYKIGRIYFEEDNFYSALTFFERAANAKEDPLFAYSVGCTLIKLEKYEVALDKFENTIKFNGNEDFLELPQQLFKVYFELKNYTEALYFIEKAIQLESSQFAGEMVEERVEFELKLAFLLKCKAETHFKMSQFEKAKEVFSTGLRMVRKVDRGESVSYLSQLAKICLKRGEVKEAKQFAEEGKMLGRQEGLEKELFKVIGLEGDIFFNGGDFEKAKSDYEECLKLSAELFGEESLEFGLSLNNLANSQFELGEFKVARENYLAAKAVFELNSKMKLVRIIDSNIERVDENKVL